MPTNREKVVHLVRTSREPLDDDQIARQTGIAPRQTVNTICRQLAAQGVVRRVPGPGGKTVNEWLGEPTDSTQEPPPDAAAGDEEVLPEIESSSPPAGSSHVQRGAERVLLKILGEKLGVALVPTRVTIPSGARVEVDGADELRTVLVECWAHQGPPKAAQKHKVISDALKLVWVATTIYPRPRLVLCLSDEAAAAPFRPGGRTWAGQALADLGVEVIVVEPPAELRQAIIDAQALQYR